MLWLAPDLNNWARMLRGTERVKFSDGWGCILQGAVEMQSMAGHFTGPSAGRYPPQKPQPEAPSTHAHLQDNPERLPNGQAHLVRPYMASCCSSNSSDVFPCTLHGLPAQTSSFTGRISGNLLFQMMAHDNCYIDCPESVCTILTFMTLRCQPVINELDVE